jgi:large subunit ribosomal protein L2
LTKLVNHSGRNNRGVISVRGRKGLNRRYRLIEFRRDRLPRQAAQVKTVEYDPNRSANIALLYYPGQNLTRYIICPQSLTPGSSVFAGPRAPIKVGNAMPLKFIPNGSLIHNIELSTGRGGQLVRSAGTYANLISKEGRFVIVKLPSKELRLISCNCYATLGQVSNIDWISQNRGKAGRARWLGKRPTVRGLAKNPIDHPHGGGEGRSPIGKSRPVTPWGKPALGSKTRKSKALSNKYILRRT